MKDFFVSYNSADRSWAEWIAWVLEENGYRVVIQAWDFRPGGNFILDMQQATAEAERTVMVLSDAYLKALYTQPEWAAAFKQDPTASERKLLPVRVAPCKPTGMLAPLVYVDLMGKPEAEAEQLLLAALQERAKERHKTPKSVVRFYDALINCRKELLWFKEPFEFANHIVFRVLNWYLKFSN